MHPSLTIYDPSVTDCIEVDFEIQTLSDDCVFTEGPVWNREGFYLFSDIPANCIYRITADGGKDIFLHGSGTRNPNDPDLKPDQAGSNALAYDRDGGLLICRHGSHDIARYADEKPKPFVSLYRGKPLNSPNDLVLHSDGRLFFSDPPYGLKEGKLNAAKFQPCAGVYCFQDGNMELICDRYQYPNGVCLSPDEKRLYICSNKPFESFISVYDTDRLKFMNVLAEENSDGIKCDRKGNVYLCNKSGIILLDPRGKRIALIQLPTIPANICWGGEEGNDLFITARENVFLIKGLQK